MLCLLVTGAALIRVILDADGGDDFTYLEACMRLVSAKNNNPNPLFLSSGAEDYFLSASYFDEGMFKVCIIIKLTFPFLPLKDIFRKVILTYYHINILYRHLIRGLQDLSQTLLLPHTKIMTMTLCYSPVVTNWFLELVKTLEVVAI